MKLNSKSTETQFEAEHRLGKAFSLRSRAQTHIVRHWSAVVSPASTKQDHNEEDNNKDQQLSQAAFADRKCARLDDKR